MLELEATPVAARITRRSLLRRPALLLGILAALVGAAGSWIPSYWGDEAASVMSANRTPVNLASLLQVVDGVHGVYYAFLHLWVGAFGTSEFATRLPSAIAAGFAVGGTVVLVREFVGTRVATIAGIVCMVLPRTTYMAGEARSYAIGTAIAVWVTVMLVRMLRHGGSRRAWFAYGVAVAASIYVFLYLAAILLVHAVVVLVFFRAVVWRWVRAVGLGVILASPVVVIAYLQRGQIGFLVHRSYATLDKALVAQWFATPLIAAVCWALILVAVGWLVVAIRRRHGRDRNRVQLVTLAAAWLVLPTSALFLANATLMPMYIDRYMTFCTPAAAILVAFGISVLGNRLPSLGRTAVTVALLLALIAVVAPTYIGQRTPFAKDGGSDFRQAAEYVHDHAIAGQTVIFDQAGKAHRKSRIALDLYPDLFAGLQDPALVTSYRDYNWLWDRATPNSEVIPQLTAQDVWAVELPTSAATPPDIAQLQHAGYRIVSAERIHRTTVYHLTRSAQ